MRHSQPLPASFRPAMLPISTFAASPRCSSCAPLRFLWRLYLCVNSFFAFLCSTSHESRPIVPYAYRTIFPPISFSFYQFPFRTEKHPGGHPPALESQNGNNPLTILIPTFSKNPSKAATPTMPLRVG